jgi:membrane-associated phospholipid phosphatase
VSNPLDSWLLHQINHWCASSRLLSDQALFINYSELPSLAIATGIITLWNCDHLDFAKSFRIRHRVVLLFLSFIPTYALARLLQRLFVRSRPMANMLLEPVGDPSLWNFMPRLFSQAGAFPSDHAALFFLFTAIIFSINQKAGWLSLVLSIYFSFLRIGIGYHWPSDIAAGAMLGTLVGWLALQFEPQLKDRLENMVFWLETNPLKTSSVAFLFLSDFANGFRYLKTIAVNIFHIYLFQ